MKKRSIRRIIKYKGRFISILVMIFLGSAIFSGLNNTSQSMKQTLINTLTESHFSQYSFLSNIGFTSEDIESIKKIKGVKQVTLSYQSDVLVQKNNQAYPMVLYSIDTLNIPKLIKGHMPNNNQEVVIDEKLKNTFPINQSLTIKNDESKSQYKIVGYIKDSRYLNKDERGSSSKGDGLNRGFIYINKQEAKKYAINKELKKLRNKELYTNINVEVNHQDDTKINQNLLLKLQSELNTKLNITYENLIKDYNKDYQKANEEYQKALDNYNKQSDTVEKEITKSEIKLDQAKLSLYNAKKTLLDNKQKLLETSNQSLYQSIQTSITNIQNHLSSLHTSEDVNVKNNDLLEINKALVTIEKNIEGINTIDTNTHTLALNELELDKQENALKQQEANLNLAKNNGNIELNDAKKALDKGNSQLKEAKKKINQIPKGTLYTLTVDENIGIRSFIANIKAIDSISKIFPVIFFLVASLVTLTSLTRLIEEERGQIGILRALGYNKKSIYFDYLSYVLIATIPSSIIGAVVGNLIFPQLIIYLYQVMMFSLYGKASYQNSIYVYLITFMISILLTTFVSLKVTYDELYHVPATLLRPKSPKAGKRIFLERIPFIWKRLPFNRKVTMRNLFRYKARFFMSIIGIGGCSALILTGFGIKNSVTSIVSEQYETIYHFDEIIHFNQTYDLQESRNLVKQLENLNEIQEAFVFESQNASLLKGNQEENGTMIVYEDENKLKEMITFKDNYKNQDDGLIITDKLASLLHVSIGDNIYLSIDNEKINANIIGITNQYYGHKIYLNRTYLEKLGLTYEVNSAYTILKDKKLKTSLNTYLKEKDLGTLESIQELKNKSVNQMQSINIVIGILILLSGILCFVVLYNLTSINIGERESEIATLKVLGYKKKEYYHYIFHENMVLSVIGSILGFVLGTGLHYFIIVAVEFENTVFIKQIPIIYYGISFALTIGFTMLINFIMRPILKKIDMVLSLKSVE